MSFTETFRNWIRNNCPLIDQNNRFNINYLGESAVEYSITTAGELHRQDILGKDMPTLNFLFVARFPYGKAQALNFSAAEFFSELAIWLRHQNYTHELPVFDGYHTEGLEVSNPGIVLSADATTAQYQIQISIDLLEV